MTEENSSPTDKVSFSVFVPFQDRRYRISLQRSDLPRLRVEKVQRDLASVTKVPVLEQYLTYNGVPLEPDVFVSVYGFEDGAQLVLDKRTSNMNQGVVQSRQVDQSPMHEVKQMGSVAMISSRSDASQSPLRATSLPRTQSPVSQTRERETTPSRQDEATLLAAQQADLLKQLQRIQNEREQEKAVKDPETSMSIPSSSLPLSEASPRVTLSSLIHSPRSNLTPEQSDILDKAEPQIRELFEENLRLRRELEYFDSSGRALDIDREREEWKRRYSSLVEQKDILSAKLICDTEDWKVEKHRLIQEYDREKKELLYENEQLRRRWDTEREGLLKAFEEKQSEWESTKQKFIDSIEEIMGEHDFVTKERERLLVALDEGARSWEIDKERILKNWSEETEILTLIWREDKDKWNRERTEMLEEMDRQRTHLIEMHKDTVNSLRSEIDLREEYIAQLNLDMERLEMELNRTYQLADEQERTAAAARVALDDLRDSLIQVANGDIELATLVVNAATERAREGQEAARLQALNEQLTIRLREETVRRRKLHNLVEDLKGSIRVLVRQRPLLAFEESREYRSGADDGSVTVVDDCSVEVVTPSMGRRFFEYFRTFGLESSQEDVFEEIRPLVQSAIDGFNITTMAYGQTGSGKTFTIMGDDFEQRGLTPRTVEELFELLESSGGIEGVRYTVRCSMVELYLDQFRDLFSASGSSNMGSSSTPSALKGLENDPKRKSLKLEVKQSPVFGSFVQNASLRVSSSANEVLNLMEMGNRLRQVHETGANSRSSRSHTVFTLYLDVHHQRENAVTRSKISFVDLAGCERVARSGSTGDRLKEATHINKSLSALGDVVSMLSSKQAHVPYRNSKLTLLLQDALGGNSKTVLIATVCPPGINSGESICTLQFASRVRLVRNPFIRNVRGNRSTEVFPADNDVDDGNPFS